MHIQTGLQAANRPGATPSSPASHDGVGALESLAGGALNQVVEGAYGNYPARAGSRRAVRWAVLAPRVALVEGLRAETTRTVRSCRPPPALRGALVPAGPGPGVARGQYPPVHRGEVGGENELGPDGLLHLGGVAVVEQPVGGEILVHRANCVASASLRPPPRPRWRRPPRCPWARRARYDQRCQGQVAAVT